MSAVGVSKAENYYGKDYFTEGTEWTMLLIPDFPLDPTSLKTVWVEKDQTSEQPRYLIFSKYANASETEVVAEVKTEGEKVLFHLLDDDESLWYLMYDFGLQPGEECEVYCPAWISDKVPEMAKFRCDEIIEKDARFDNWPTMILTETTYVDEFGEDITDQGIWIKGLGDQRGVLTNYSYFTAGGGSKLIKVENDDTVVFDLTASTQVTTIGNDEIELRLDGNILIIDSASNGEKALLYDLNGILISTIDLSKNHNEINLPQKGLYILKIGDKSKEILVK